MREKNFHFHIPVELIKGSSKDNEDGEEAVDSWKIRGIASTPDVDLQGEKVLQEGLDISILKAGKGLFNDNHKGSITDVLGQIDDAMFVDHNGKQALMVEGYLFKHQEKAKAYYAVMKSVRKGGPPRVHFSIEGKVLERDYTNTSTIKKASISKVALTLDPVNPCTYADLVKSLSAENIEAPSINLEELKGKVQEALGEWVKAMTAGAGYADAPGTRTDGAAMQKESINGSPLSVICKKDKKKKKINKSMVKSLIETVCKALPSADPSEVTTLVFERIQNKSKGES